MYFSVPGYGIDWITYFSFCPQIQMNEFDLSSIQTIGYESFDGRIIDDLDYSHFETNSRDITDDWDCPY